MNNKHLGKHQKKMLEFVRKYGLFSVAHDPITQRTAKSLEKRELIKINQFGQIEAK